MMTQQLGFSILTAPLAAIDRRSLSQAWYSALHLASAKTQPASTQARTGGVPPRDRGTRAALSAAGGGAKRPISFVPARTVQTANSRPAEAPERRAARSTLARRIERTFLNPVARVQRATFTVEGTSARVHVALQSTKDGVRIVAVCPPSIRTRVSRALDEVRYALAARGIVFHADVSEA